MATKTKTSAKTGLTSPAKPKNTKSNIKIGSLKGKIEIAPDTWDDDLRKTVS